MRAATERLQIYEETARCERPTLLLPGAGRAGRRAFPVHRDGGA